MAKGFLPRVSSYFTSTLKSFDMYPHTVSFTFKGQEEFKTMMGGFISFVIKVVILYYTYVMVRLMLERKNTQKNVNSVVKDILNDQTAFHMNGTDFSFGFQLLVGDEEGLELEGNEYFEVEIIKNIKLANGDLQEEVVPFAKCGDTLFKYYNQTEVNLLGINDFYCPTKSDFVIQGSAISNDFSNFELRVKYCTDEWLTACPPDLNEKINNMMVRVPFVNNYFDFDDYKNPVKTYIDDRFELYMIDTLYQQQNSFIQVNEAEVQDSYFAYQPGGSNKEFFEIERVDTKLISSQVHQGELLNLKFVKDAASKSYERTVFSFMEVTGNIGGLFEILQIAGGFIVGIFSGRLFTFSMFSSLYHVDMPSNNKAKKVNEETKVNFYKIQKTNRECTGSSNNLEEVATEAHNRMRSRVRYDWKLSDFLVNLCSLFSCCFCRCIKRRYELFEKGEKKFIKEFDAVYYARNMRNLNTLVTSMMDDSEKVMITYQKQNAIPAESDETSENQDENFDDVPKMFSNKMLKEKHIQKIDLFMRKYSKEKWTEKDFRLLNGVFNKQQLTNQQIQKIEIDQDSGWYNIQQPEESKDYSKVGNTDTEEKKLAEGKCNSLLKLPISPHPPISLGNSKI
ncbi:unnamed protein product [Moneuplotes crassus]|uniref:Uncharacterized protein n=1 Tax=Euplotes crassus TaxID=5936 RepID=A0AAD1Y8I4_EUPCR|nr:unnamed protein product [Moneuplotes crassus]